MQKQVHYIFIDEITYYLYEPCMEKKKKKPIYDFIILNLFLRYEFILYF
jgi:hypothetical protein